MGHLSQEEGVSGEEGRIDREELADMQTGDPNSLISILIERALALEIR